MTGVDFGLFGLGWGTSPGYVLGWVYNLPFLEYLCRLVLAKTPELSE